MICQMIMSWQCKHKIGIGHEFIDSTIRDEIVEFIFDVNIYVIIVLFILSKYGNCIVMNQH
jgi:hypothetical protein